MKYKRIIHFTINFNYQLHDAPNITNKSNTQIKNNKQKSAYTATLPYFKILYLINHFNH